MARFRFPQPQCSPYSKRLFILTADYHFWDKGKKYTIKKGFKWNGMSVPKAAWSLVGTPFGPMHCAAGLIHDWLYAKGLLSRLAADRLMKIVLEEHGEKEKIIEAMYKSVRIFGKKHYKGA